MAERGGGFFDKMKESFSWGKKKEEDINKLSAEELKKRLKYNSSGSVIRDAAAIRLEEIQKAKKLGAQKKSEVPVRAAIPSAKPDFSSPRRNKPFEFKLTPESEFEKVTPQPKPPEAKKPNEKIIDMQANGKGEFDVVKHESDSFIIPKDPGINPYTRRLERVQDKRVAKWSPPTPPPYQPRVKGLIESGQGKELVKHTPEEVIKWEKPEPVPPIPEPVPVPPKKPEEFERKLERVQLADIDAIVESYADRVAGKKLKERMDSSSIATKWFFRLAEDGYYKKYFDEAKQEIMKNHNLLSQIETRWLKKSEGVPLRADAGDIHYEILDTIVEAFDKRLLEERSTEIKSEHIRNMNVDLEAGRLFADFAMGRITDRAQFDRLVEERVVPNVPGAKSGGRMYASNLYQLAERYRGEVQERLRATGKELGPEQEAYVKLFFEKTLSLDIQLGEKNRDMAQRLPGESMKGYEKFVDLTQNGFFNGNSKTGRAIGRIVANPITYAAVGGLLARGLTKGAAVGILSAVTFGSATAVIIGTGIGAGIYMGFRAARERRRDLMRGEQEAVLGQKGRETHELKQARVLILQVEALQAKGVALTPEEKQEVAEIRAMLRLQTNQKVDLIGVGANEGGRAGTKLIAETDLRKALESFWQAKRGEFGATEVEQQRAYDRLVGDAETRMLPEIQRVNKEVADEIRKRGIKMGLIGGAAAAVMTGVMGGYVTRGIEHTADKFFSGQHHADVFHGPIVDHAPGFMHGHAELNLPAGYEAHDVLDHGNHFINLTGPDGHIIPGAEHIAVGPDGKILSAGALDALRAQGWNIQENVTHTTTGGGGGGGGGSSPFNLNKVHRVDWHDEPGSHYSTIHHKNILYEGKQQELFLKDTGTGVKADVHMMAKNLIDNIQHKFTEFGHNPDSSVDTKLSGLETKLMEWYNHGGVDEVQSHLKINLIPTSAANAHGLGMLTGGAHNGEIDLSSFDSVLKAPGATLHDQTLGVFRMEAGIDDGSGFHVLATGSGHDAILPAAGGVGAPGTESSFFQYNMRPGAAEELEYPFPLAGNRRETNTDSEKNAAARLERLNPKKPSPPVEPVKTTGGGKVVPPGPTGPTIPPVEGPQMSFDEAVQEIFYGKKPSSERAEKSPQERAIDALRNGLDNNNLKEADIDKAAQEFNVSKTEILTRCLDAKGINYQQQESEILRAAQLDRSDYNRAQILWQILERSMNTAPKRPATPEPAVKRETKTTSGPTPGKPMPGMPAPLPNTPGRPTPGYPEGYVRGSNEVATEAPSAAPETQEQADLAETLTGKFSKIEVNVTGDAQNKFATETEGKRGRMVSAYEKALKTINEKLVKAKFKGKIKLQVGKFLINPKNPRDFGVPIGTTERAIVKHITDELVRRKLLPKEGVSAAGEAEKVPEAKKKP